MDFFNTHEPHANQIEDKQLLMRYEARRKVYRDDAKEGTDRYEVEEEAAPEWDDCVVSSNGPGDEESSYFMFRMSSHFLEHVQPELDGFVHSKLEAFTGSSVNLGCSTHSLLQYDIYQEYVSKFEHLMLGFTVEYSTDQLVDALNRAVRVSTTGKESMGTMVLDMIDALSSFEGNDIVYFDIKCARDRNVLLSYAIDFHAMMIEEATTRKPGECKDTAPDSKDCKYGAK